MTLARIAAVFLVAVVLDTVAGLCTGTGSQRGNCGLAFFVLKVL